MRRFCVLRSIISVWIILLNLLIFCPASEATLKGGCAKVNITPPLGIELIGSKGKPSDDILDELYSKALVLNNENTTIAIVSVDLLYTPLEEITNPVRRIIKEKTGIREQNVLICATHTHSGPEVFTRSKHGPDKEVPISKIDQIYLQILIKKIADTVLIAHRNMQEVRIGGAKGQIPEIVYNRRPRTGDGLVKMAFTLPPEVIATQKVKRGPDDSVRVTFDYTHEDEKVDFGPIDPDVCVLRVEDVNGGIVGSLVNFGCHPVCIYPYLNTSISADYPAYATGVVEKVEGGICLFALGLAGNIVPVRRGVKPRQQIGKALGAEALKRLQLITTTGSVTLKALKKEIKFQTKKALSPNGKTNDNKTIDYITTEIQVLRLGDIYILGLPGEILVEVGLDIKRKTGLENLFITTVSNDTIGYVCHSRAYEEEGYESGSGTNLAKGAGEIMTEKAVELINQIRKTDD
ncbi:MAG: hypothetical protein GWN67_11320 [Phycisphaerae bacterium]|nr:hypothetical protein [Phycisphaerae bacterium]NIP54998.1 hypothetical protein [Phycisphaerae bacterium]NIS53713.1 hypothetical protein [Phycisphaerae bacterium]NIU11284.1 hypothetical protein [Phycisphaerae bacterium]NIU56941.1 hypothetical protein [Phycisphaerae bacterium]